ncbi:MAG: ORF6N domain-containing protein [Gaiellales bacterium]
MPDSLSDPAAQPGHLGDRPDVRMRVHVLRDVHVILDADLADLYGVTSGRLMEQVRRNAARFPADFMFQLNANDVVYFKSPNAISSTRHGGRRVAPYAFTEQGVAMLSGVLRSERAVRVNIEIMRAFVALRRFAATHDDLARRVADLEQEMRIKLGEHDESLATIAEVLRALSAPSPRTRGRVGFAPPACD